jgi:hypothetical protein
MVDAHQLTTDSAMKLRTQFLSGLFTGCFFGTAVLAVTGLFIARVPALRWVLLAEWVAIFGFAYSWIRRFQGRLPKPTRKQESKVASSARNLGVFFIVAPVLGYIARGSELIALPYGLGFILPLIPLGLAVYCLRVSAQLRRNSGIEDASSLR